MTISRRGRLFAAIGAIALIPAALTACSGGQSVADACKVAQDTITDAMGDMSSVATDPEAAMSALDDAMTAMKDAGDKVENEEVKGAFDDFNGAFGEFQDLMSSAADDPASIDTDAMTEISTKIQDSAATMQELCVG